MSARRRGLSRRDLFGGLLRRPLEDLREKLPELAPGAPPPPASLPHTRTGAIGYAQRRRPPEHTVKAAPDAAGRYRVDLAAHPLGVGMSWRVVADDLAEALVLVRVDETHYAAATGECPLEGSDVFWRRAEDLLWCPACGSQWRMDGSVARGPVRRGLLSLHVDVLEDVARIDVP